MPRAQDNPFGFSLRPRRESVTLSDIRRMQEAEADNLACKHRDYTRAKRVLKQRPAAYARAHGLRLSTSPRPGAGAISRAPAARPEARLERAEREVEEAKRGGSREEYQAALKRYTEAQYEVEKMKGRKKNPQLGPGVIAMYGGPYAGSKVFIERGSADTRDYWVAYGGRRKGFDTLAEARAFAKEEGRLRTEAAERKYGMRNPYGLRKKENPSDYLLLDANSGREITHTASLTEAKRAAKKLWPNAYFGEKDEFEPGSFSILVFGSRREFNETAASHPRAEISWEGGTKNPSAKQNNPRRSYRPGTRVSVNEPMARGMGTIVSLREVGADGRGVPNVPGAYKPLSAGQVIVRMDNGRYSIARKAAVRPLSRNPSREDYFIGGAIKRPGALHRKLGVPEGEDIPVRLLQEAIAHPERFERTHAAQMRLKKEAVLARTLKGLPRHYGPHKENPSDRQIKYLLYLLHENGYSTRFMDSKFKELGATMRERSGSVENWLRGLDYTRTRELFDALKPSERRNPEVTLSSASDLYDDFHGEPPHRIGEYEVDTSIPSNLAELGLLLKIKIIGRGRILQRLAWAPEEGVKLAASPGKNQSLYIIGERQRLPENLMQEIGREWGDVVLKDVFPLGTIKEITYRAKKGFDKFEDIDYYHELGEETGDRPLLLYDRRNHRLLIAGGAYKVKPEGIVN